LELILGAPGRASRGADDETGGDRLVTGAPCHPPARRL